MYMQGENALLVTEVSQRKTLVTFKKIGFYILYIIKVIGKKYPGWEHSRNTTQCFPRN